MAEIVFWSLVSFFSAVGVVQTIDYLKRLFYKNKIEPPIILILQKDDASCAEAQVRYILSQLTMESRVVLVDMGLSEEGKLVLNRIKNLFPVTLILKEEIEKILSPV